ncbi:MAG: oligosaccharide flippase family protein [Thermoleophilia bacterium]|nr:oligosaccharide flippase family protein [Thermoleophilia bacterium]
MTDSPLDSPPDPVPVATDAGVELKSQAVRGAALLSVRQILVGVVTVGGIIALPLLLSPAEFSLYGYVNTVILVGAALGDLGLAAHIMKNQMSGRDLGRSLAMQLAFWGGLCLILLAVSATLNPFGFSMLTNSLLLFGLFLFALQALPTALLEKELRFKRISAIEIVQRIVLISIAITLAAVNPSEWSIPLAAAVAALIGYPAVLKASAWRWRPRLGGGEPLFKGFSSQWWQVRIVNQAAYAAYPLLGGLLYTAHEVGLIVWAIAITSIPAYFAPMVARATFPTLARAEDKERAEIYSSLFRGLLLIGMPLVAGLLVSAGAITEHIFGPEWTGGITLLRLESVTTAIGIATSSIVPFLFLSCPPSTVRWICVSSLGAIIVFSIALTPWFSFLSISIATIIAVSVQLVLFDHLLRRDLSYSPLRDMAPAIAGLVVGVAAGLPIVLASDSLLAGIAGGILAAVIQIAVTFLLKGGVDVREVLNRRGGGPVQARN